MGDVLTYLIDGTSGLAPGGVPRYTGNKQKPRIAARSTRPGGAKKE